MSILLQGIVYFILALFLFFTINFIGRHSINFGYTQITLYGKADEAPGFNFILRTIAPVVYLFIVSAILYETRFFKLVQNIWWVIVIYFLIRLGYTILFGRSRLVNWARFILVMSVSLILTFIAFKYVILQKKNIIPDYGSISNELWALVIIYVLSVLNNLQFSEERLSLRKNKYMKDQFIKYQREYQGILEELQVKNLRLQIIIYSIIIYENFNRPYWVRVFEYILFPFGLSKTLGVMQVQTSKLINDRTSVRMGTELLISSFEKHVKAIDPNESFWYQERKLTRKIIADYNRDENYVDEIIKLSSIIEDYFPDGEHTLLLEQSKVIDNPKKSSNIVVSFFRKIFK